MKQVTKFYISSFLKNQTYFTPIFILFLQFHNLSFKEVFLVFTIGSIASFLLEIPTGVIADLWGRRRSILLARFLTLGSYVIFAFSKSFWLFVIAQIVYEIASSFKSGTEAAYVYDYLDDHKGEPSYTLVKGKQKYYARIGEAIATFIGGILAVSFGYNAVFIFAAIPALVNLLITSTWLKIDDHSKKLSLKNSYEHVYDSLIHIKDYSGLFKIMINIMFFYSILQAVNKFIQPYMVSVGVNVAYFGIIYSVFLIMSAFAVKYSFVIENKLGSRKAMNYLTLIAGVPLIIIGLGFKSYCGILLFFSVSIIENFRSPIANTEFHNKIKKTQRATIGSILALFKSIGKIIILPIVGFMADFYSIYFATLILGFMLLFVGIVFRIKSNSGYRK